MLLPQLMICPIQITFQLRILFHYPVKQQMVMRSLPLVKPILPTQPLVSLSHVVVIDLVRNLAGKKAFHFKYFSQKVLSLPLSFYLSSRFQTLPFVDAFFTLNFSTFSLVFVFSAVAFRFFVCFLLCFVSPFRVLGVFFVEFHIYEFRFLDLESFFNQCSS